MMKPVVQFDEDIVEMLGNARRALLVAFQEKEARAVDALLTKEKGKTTVAHESILSKYVTLQK